MANNLKKPDIVCIKSIRSVDSNEENWIAIGEIRKTVGLKGWIRISLLTDYPDRFEPGEELLLKKPFAKPESVVVEDWKPHFDENSVDILLERVDSCEQASVYVNRLVVIPKDERETLDSDDEVYPDELDGMSVIDSDGSKCGKIIRMEADAPCPYLVVATNSDGEVMIPFLHKFIDSIDKINRTIKLVENIKFHIPVE